MNYFKELSFIESVEVYNSLDKKLENTVTKEFLLDVIKASFGAKETKSQVSKANNGTNNKTNKLDKDLEGYF